MSQTEKEKWREICRMNTDMHIFMRDWWLDAVCGEEDWDVVLVEKGGEIVACMPFAKVRSKGFLHLGTPVLTQKLGPWIKYPTGQKYSTKQEYEKKIFTELIEKLPKADVIASTFDYHITNWLPFYWKGFQSSTYYTYVIESLSDMDRVYNELASDIKNQLRKAEKLLVCEVCHDAGDFYRINKMTFDRQGIDMPYSEEFFKRLVQAAKEHKAGKMYMAKDDAGRIHAVAYMVWDETCAYYLLGGADPELRKSSAQVFLLWHMIQDAAKFTKSFDFEGTMLPQANKMFRNFATKQMPYFKIEKIYSRKLQFLKSLKAMIGALK